MKTIDYEAILRNTLSKYDNEPSWIFTPEDANDVMKEAVSQAIDIVLEETNEKYEIGEGAVVLLNNILKERLCK